MRKLLTSLLLIALMAAGTTGAAEEMSGGLGNPGVSLNAEVAVEGPRVHLGDVFAGAGAKAATVLGGAPAPGESITLSADWLGRAARHYELDWRPTAGSRSVITRSARFIEGPAIRRAIAREIGGAGDLEVDLDQSRARLVLPASETGPVRVLGLRHDPRTGRFRAQVAAGTGSARKDISVSGRAAQRVEVPVLARRVPRGEVIGQNDVIWRTLPETALNRGDLRALGDIVGQAARRTLRADTPLRASDLEAPVLVERNSRVTVRLDTPRMRLSVQGRALADGAEGELVRVLNTLSKTTVSGTVMSDGSVAVQTASN